MVSGCLRKKCDMAHKCVGTKCVMTHFATELQGAEEYIILGRAMGRIWTIDSAEKVPF